jgi:hypothetical protein
MRLNFKNVLKNTSILTVLSILTGLYVLSAYFIIHTTWVYNTPDSYFRSHHEYFALANSVAYFLLFLPFGISIYYYNLEENDDVLLSFLRGAFDFASINIVTDLSVFHIKDPTGLFFSNAVICICLISAWYSILVDTLRSKPKNDDIQPSIYI